jgi:hypothetical protein
MEILIHFLSKSEIESQAGKIGLLAINGLVSARTAELIEFFEVIV